MLEGNWRTATSVLVSKGNRHIVVDTGMAHEAHLLLNALAKHGVEASDVRCLINTHFHIDHVLNNVLFPNSEIYASQESYNWCRSLYSDLADDQWETLLPKYYPEMPSYPHAMERLHQMRKFTLRWWDLKRLGGPGQFRWIEQEGLPDGFGTIITSGHVPGHVSVMLPDGAQRTIIAGDAFLCRADDEKVMTMIPHNREQARLDREQVLARGTRIFPGHDAEFLNTSNGA